MNTTTNKGASNSNSFGRWLDTMLDEKGIDLEQTFEVTGPVYGANWMAYSHVVEAMKTAPASEQKAIKAMLVKIDFVNGDVCRFLRHLAQAIAL